MLFVIASRHTSHLSLETLELVLAKTRGLAQRVEEECGAQTLRNPLAGGTASEDPSAHHRAVRPKVEESAWPHQSAATAETETDADLDDDRSSDSTDSTVGDDLAASSVGGEHHSPTSTAGIEIDDLDDDVSTASAGPDKDTAVAPVAAPVQQPAPLLVPSRALRDAVPVLPEGGGLALKVGLAALPLLRLLIAQLNMVRSRRVATKIMQAMSAAARKPAVSSMSGARPVPGDDAWLASHRALLEAVPFRSLTDGSEFFE